MLPKHQALRGLQFHIKRICSGGCLGVAACIHHSPCVAAALGIGAFSVNTSHGSLPYLVFVHTGTDDHRFSFDNASYVHLINRSFDPVCSRTENGNKSILTAFSCHTSIRIAHILIHIVHAAVICCKLCGIDLLDHSVNRTSYFCISHCILELRNLRLLAFLTVFIFFEIHFICFDLNGIRELVVFFRLLFFFFKSGDLFAQTGGFIFQTVKIKLGLLQILLDTGKIIFKKKLSLLYLLAGLYFHCFYFTSVFQLYLFCFLRFHNTGIPVCDSRNVSGDLADLCNIGGFSAFLLLPEKSQFPADSSCSAANYKNPQKDQNTFFHIFYFYLPVNKGTIITVHDLHSNELSDCTIIADYALKEKS